MPSHSALLEHGQPPGYVAHLWDPFVGGVSRRGGGRANRSFHGLRLLLLLLELRGSLLSSLCVATCSMSLTTDHAKRQLISSFMVP